MIMKNLSFDQEAYTDFNKKAYPKRKDFSWETLVDWRIFENPFFTYFDPSLISMEGDNIVGQILPLYSRLVSGEHIHNCVWGVDYIVDRDHRGKGLGKKILAEMLNRYLHFGVGMPEISIHLVKKLGEHQHTNRYDLVFWAGGIQKTKYQIESFDRFVNNFEQIIKPEYDRWSITYFDRSAAFYNWIFKKAEKEKISVLRTENSFSFIILYRSTWKGIPIHWVVDYSPDFLINPSPFLNLLQSYGAKSFGKAFFYSGTLDLSGQVRSIRNRVYPVYSNIEKRGLRFRTDYSWHITGLDSDRFFSLFL